MTEYPLSVILHIFLVKLTLHRFQLHSRIHEITRLNMHVCFVILFNFIDRYNNVKLNGGLIIEIFYNNNIGLELDDLLEI